MTDDGRPLPAFDPQPTPGNSRSARKGSHILAVQWQGDFLDGVAFPLSPELNCLIGGKGTGKSTVIETIRYAFDLPYRTSTVEDAGRSLLKHAFRSASKVSVVVETDLPTPKRYVVERTAPHAPVVRDHAGRPFPELEPRQLLRPCVYGQKEIYGIAQDARARLEMLDGFAAQLLGDVAGREQELVERLRENARVILDSLRRIDDAETRLKELPGLETWRERFREAGFEEKLRERRDLDREARLLEEARKALAGRRTALAGPALGGEDLASRLDPAQIEALPNRPLLERVRSTLDELDRAWAEARRVLEARVDEAARELAELRRSWADRRAARTEAFERALRDLQERMPDVDPEEYLDVERRIERLAPLRATTKELEARLAAARGERATLLIELIEARAEKHRLRQGAADRLNLALAGNVVVDITYQGERDAFVGRLKELRTGARVDALERLVGGPTFSPAVFAEHVRGHELARKLSVPAGQAAALERSLGEETLLELEVVELEDRVELRFDVAPSGGTPELRALERLSPGQRSTAILLLVMQESRDPLLIDQPEDDLDNRFVYDDVVKRLREAKPLRQFLIATHNANIPILGDAEQIVALDAREHSPGAPVRSEVRARGSIDNSGVREAAELILEGGREAFELRRRKYEA